MQINSLDKGTAKYFVAKAGKVGARDKTGWEYENKTAAGLEPVQTTQEKKRVKVGMSAQVGAPGRLEYLVFEAVSHLSIRRIADDQVELSLQRHGKRVAPLDDLKRSRAPKIIFPG